MRPSELLRGLGQPATYYPEMRKITGSLTSTVFFFNFYYWTGSEKSQDGWIYKSTEQIEKETGLTYEEQKTARAKLKKIGLLEEHYRRLEHLMYYRVRPDMFDHLWSEVYGDSHIREQGNPSFGEQGNPSFDPICTLLTTSSIGKKPSKRKEPKPLDPKIEQIISVYNETAKLMKWIQFSHSSKATRLNAILKNRSEDDQWMADLPRYARMMQKYEWTEGWSIENFLRPLNMKKCFNGAWSDKSSTSYAPQPQEELDLSKPWNRPMKEPANAS